jgi:hypothetical protein
MRSAQLTRSAFDPDTSAFAWQSAHRIGVPEYWTRSSSVSAAISL